MPPVTISPDNKHVQAYLAQMAQYRGQLATHEGATRQAFQTLLDQTSPKNWVVIAEKTRDSALHNRTRIRYDGVLQDQWTIPRGFWYYDKQRS